MQKNKINVFGRNITSQYGEDGIIEYILKHINTNKICVEFGAWDGKFLSNTFSLWHDNKWQGILVEADKEKCDALKKRYSSYNINVFNKLLEPKRENSIDALFKNNQLNPNVGLISIDIDSFDYHIWKNMEYVNPDIVIIEHNPTIPGYVEYYDPEGETFLKCSAKALETLGKSKGYKLICCTKTNSIFIKNELFNNEFFPDMPVEYLFDYSFCSSPILSADRNPVHNLIPIFYGSPNKFHKICYPIINRILALLRHKNYKRPSKKIIAQCEKAGITVL
ncbi:MAG: hypothetical protein HQ539_03210 [Parcubacteria group bacterium]|nr:hypothetical protein [Parcubacteria group bacterium]